MRVLVLFLVSATAHYLVMRWLSSVSPWARAHRSRVAAVVFAVAVVAPLLRVVAWLTEATVARMALAAAMVELATVVIALPFVGASLLLTRTAARLVAPREEEARAALVTRREAVECIAGVAAFGGTGLALGWGVARGRHAFAVEEVVVRVPGWPRVLDGYVIAQVSDVHVGPFVGDRELDEGFDVVRRIRPDLVVATGDLVDSEADLIPHLAKRLLGVPARDGAFAILGNHDHYGGAADVVALARSCGLPVLCNESRVLRGVDGGGFALVGVDDLQGRVRGVPGYRGPDLARALAGVDAERPRILLAHQPRYLLESAGRVALQLSGHTHGGQINPGFRPASLFMPYVAGRYERAGTTLWVNRGFGVVGPPSRIGAPPEVTKLVIVAG